MVFLGTYWKMLSTCNIMMYENVIKLALVKGSKYLIFPLAVTNENSQWKCSNYAVDPRNLLRRKGVFLSFVNCLETPIGLR